jgi:hypothetical protein
MHHVTEMMDLEIAIMIYNTFSVLFSVKDLK